MARFLSEATRSLVISRIPDFPNLTPEEQAIEGIRVISADFWLYCERNLMVKDKETHQIIPLVPNWAQKILVESVIDDLAHGRPVRYIILKARQMGLSTIIEALCYWWTTTHRYINSVIIAHEQDASKNLYKMFRRYYDHSHENFRPTRKYNTKTDLTFDVEDAVKDEYRALGKASPGLASEIKTMVAKEGKGRSDTINFFHGSEVAFWEKGSDILSSALQAIPLSRNTFAFLESTANGVGGYFYREWQYAKKGESSFKPLFFAWHEHPDYELEGTVETYDEEELELLEIFKEKNYVRDSWDRKVIWRREKKKEFRSEPDKFYQEYPKDDVEAFLASGRPVFDVRQLVKMEMRAEQFKPKFGDVRIVIDKNNVSRHSFVEIPVSFHEQDPSPLKVWFLPKKGKKYVIGVDVSEGIKKTANEKEENDYAVIDVMDLETQITVARWRGHVDADQLGDVVFDLGTFYNYALVGVEVNSYGIATVQKLRNKFYRNLYQRESDEEEQFQVRTTKMGWLTTKKTKRVMITDLAAAVREGAIIDLDVIFIRECMTYVRDDQGYTDAQEGMFDDTVMAKAICLQMANWNKYDTEEAKEQIFKPTKRQGNGSNKTSNRAILSRRREARRSHRRVSAK